MPRLRVAGELVARMPKKLDVRLCVGSLISPRSTVWRFFSSKSDVYVSHGTNSIAKLSFHRSGICRDAFTQEFGVPNTMSDRLIYRWRRAEVPPAGSGRACLLLRIWIATDFLSSAIDPPAKKTTWLQPASSGNGRVIELMLCRDDEAFVREQMGDAREFVAYSRLLDGNAAVIGTRAVAGTHKDFFVPASHHQKKALIVSAADPQDTGRPARFYYGTNPKDGDCKELWEFGGYFTNGPIPLGLSSFSRTTVLATQDTPTIKLKS
jgi:hypothetical protein